MCDRYPRGIMTLTVAEYTQLIAVTARLEEALRQALGRAGVPPVEIPHAAADGGTEFPVLESGWGTEAMRAAAAALRDNGASSYSLEDARLVRPELAVAGEAPQPVIARPGFASDMLRVLRHFDPGQGSGLSTPDMFAAGLAAFIGGVNEDQWSRGIAASGEVYAALPPGDPVPMRVDYSSERRDGMERYLDLHPGLITYHTRDIIYLEQLARAVDALRPGDVNETLATQLLNLKGRLDIIVDDLLLYFLEHDSIPTLHTERIQRLLFHSERPVRIGRLHLNMTDANMADPSERLGHIYLSAVLKWLSAKFPDAHVIQSPERTTFQFVITEGLDLKEMFRDYAREVKSRMRHLNGAEPPGQQVDAKTMSGFIATGLVAELPLSRGNILTYAVRTPEDVQTFREILKEIVPNDSLLDSMERDSSAIPLLLGSKRVDFMALSRKYTRAIRALERLRKDAEGLSQDALAATRPHEFEELVDDELEDFTPPIEWQIEGETLAVGDSSDSGAASADELIARYRRLKKALQALLLQGVNNFSRTLAGHTSYWEKERVGLSRHPQVITDGVPADGAADYGTYRRYVDSGVGYVPYGRYDPLLDNPDFAGFDLGDLPQYSYGVRPSAPPDGNAIDSILANHPRWGHVAGRLSSPRRGEIPGGAREYLFIAIDGVVDSVRASEGERAERLADLKLRLHFLVEQARNIWRLAIEDRKYSAGLNRHDTFETLSGVKNSNVFLQETALRGWRNVAALEYDSFKAFSERYPSDHKDRQFLEPRDLILKVAKDWNMPVPLIIPSGGDLLFLSWADEDRAGREIEPDAFLKEVQNRIRERYSDRSYPDMKKIQMLEADILFDGEYADGVVDDALASVADKLGMQTVPEIVGNGVRVKLYVPENDEGNPSAGLDDVLRGLDEEGIMINSVMDRRCTLTSRQKIWINDGSNWGAMPYRFGNVRPTNSSPFEKTLTVSVAHARIERIANPFQMGSVRHTLCRLADMVESVKQENFPHKEGFGSLASDAPKEEGSDPGVGRIPQGEAGSQPPPGYGCPRLDGASFDGIAYAGSIPGVNERPGILADGPMMAGFGVGTAFAPIVAGQMPLNTLFAAATSVQALLGAI